MHRLNEVILAAASITLASLILLILRVGLSLAVEILKNQIFEDSKPFQKDEVKNVQERCANMILEYIEATTNSNEVYRCFFDFDCPREMCPGPMERPECMKTTFCKCVQWVPTTD
ncbi:hypothetical protein P8452_13154 [Trifolium repens]|nr:hypothetical protein P8452_13154 [Trifolium repens]